MTYLNHAKAHLQRSVGRAGRFGRNLPGGCLGKQRAAGEQLLASGRGGEHISNRLPILCKVYRGKGDDP